LQAAAIRKVDFKIELNAPVFGGVIHVEHKS
jgi:hypothetical protein